MTQTTTGIKLDDALRERLRALGTARDRSPHWIIKAALVEYLDREESYERERREDEARWQRFQLTDNALSQEQAFAFLDRLRQGEAGGMMVQEVASGYETVSKPASKRRK